MQNFCFTLTEQLYKKEEKLLFKISKVPFSDEEVKKFSFLIAQKRNIRKAFNAIHMCCCHFGIMGNMQKYSSSYVQHRMFHLHRNRVQKERVNDKC
jgi:hypothetical protein